MLPFMQSRSISGPERPDLTCMPPGNVHPHPLSCPKTQTLIAMLSVIVNQLVTP